MGFLKVAHSFTAQTPPMATLLVPIRGFRLVTHPIPLNRPLGRYPLKAWLCAKTKPGQVLLYGFSGWNAGHTIGVWEQKN